MQSVLFIISILLFSGFSMAQNVGINNPNPGAKLDVIGTVKIADGSQAIGRVLTSDAVGLASWQDLPDVTAVFSVATDQSVSNGQYLGLGTSSSTFIRQVIVVPFNCTLTGIMFSIKGISSGSFTCEVWKSPGNLSIPVPVATGLSAIIPNGTVIFFASGTGSIALLAGDLISVKFTGGTLANGVAASIIYK
ncbi:MAG: hypothetical protein ABI761_19085 [Saprospiraceae bacterium]